MKKFKTQTATITGLRIIALAGAVLSIIISIAVDIGGLIFLVFAGVLYFMSFIGYISRIVIQDEIIDVKVPFVRGKYIKTDLKEIVVCGSNLSFGMSVVDLFFTKDGVKKGVRTQSNKKLIEALLKDFTGVIKLETSYVEKVKVQMMQLGAKETMFE